MYVYLSKKVGISAAGQIYSVSWNHCHGWIACAASNGQVKILQIQPQQNATTTTTAAANTNSSSNTNIAMNQTLQGHRGNVIQTIWNHAYDKLTTTDQYGMIIVWILQDGTWHEEMINNRNQSVVRDMAWSGDGQQICIVYEDGAVIVGSVDGNRLWGKEFNHQLSAVAWSPKSKTILFGTSQGRVQIHSASGQYLTDLVTMSSDGCRIVSIEWYDGSRGQLTTGGRITTCQLVIGFNNGSIQFMINTSDPAPILVQTPLQAIQSMAWSTNGHYLTVAGPARHDQSPLVVLYDSHAQLLRQLPIPGQSLQSLCWDKTSLYLCIAVDSSLFLAAVRPRYPLLHLPDHTLIYTFQRPDRTEQCLMFWDSYLNERHLKYVPDFISMCSSGRLCLLATCSDDADDLPNTFVYVICSTIGSAIQSRCSMVEPKFVSMTSSCVIGANQSCIYCWVYDSHDPDPNPSYSSGSTDERILHIDDPHHTSASIYSHKRPSSKVTKPSQDPIQCIDARNDVLLVARQSGLIHRYSLPYLQFIQKFKLPTVIEKMQLNCSCTRLAVIDTTSTMMLIDIEKVDEPGYESDLHRRKDVWDICWADDNPDLLAFMEKSRIYIYRGKQAEEPISSAAYLLQFNDLVLTCIMMDEIQQDPHNPQPSHLIQYDTKSLRDTRILLDTVPYNEVYQFIYDNPHPRLWRLLAESALNRLDFVYASKAFVQSQDYQGIQLVKRLQKQVDKSRQLAEVAAYFKRFEEAEELYLREGHRHAAIDLRIQLGDWFRVVQLLQMEGAGNDDLLQGAADSIGDYYADRMKWDKATKYYLQSRNTTAAIEAAYNFEDYSTLQSILNDLPVQSPLCLRIAELFGSVGLCTESVQAYLKYGDTQGAINICIRLNEWSAAIELAEKHQMPEIETLLAQYARHLLQKNEPFQAIALYMRAHRYHDSAMLLKQQVDPANPLTAKKLLVCAALQLDLARKQIGNMGDKQEREQTIASLLNEGIKSSSTTTSSNESAWHPAEAYHFLMMSQRALYAKSFNSAMIAALRLQHYESVLSPKLIYSTIALATFHNGFYEQCSNAFMKLEMLEGATQAERDFYRMLAFAIFERHPPQDPATREFRCPNPSCSAFVNEWRVSCQSCEVKFPGCVASGRSIFMSSSSYTCACCDHAILESEMSSCTFCPLCHAAN